MQGVQFSHGRSRERQDEVLKPGMQNKCEMKHLQEEKIQYNNKGTAFDGEKAG